MHVANTRIGFFTATTVPTTQEAADILVFKNLGFKVCVRNAEAYVAATTDEPEDFDYVADSNSGNNIPADYADTGDYPRASKTAPPTPEVLSTQAVITSGVEFASPDASGTYVNGFTPTIANHVVTALTGS
jgi:hypothetical protein